MEEFISNGLTKPVCGALLLSLFAVPVTVEPVAIVSLSLNVWLSISLAYDRTLAKLFTERSYFPWLEKMLELLEPFDSKENDDLADSGSMNVS
ncbi:hypothetical protein OGATHE_005659 [Ogataea polymorpha]|uniref:Uncharacterized protein n=1 Tax=Ogataea polymorpha TaxID=460523 RepID=A0A9P8SZ15_9ASCO|nr:hypothetical protein OGATHE_005659 [Ogataea polymorpha]